MPAYDRSRFDPPAPLAHVTLRNLGTGSGTFSVPMLLDSGADVTLIPRTALTEIDVTPAEEEDYELVSFNGSTTVAASARLDLVFLGKTFRGRYLTMDREYGILGRDVLNLVSLLLDGPRFAWRENTSGRI